MGQYLKKFENHDDYEDFVDGGTMVKPNVSYCVNENEVHYNPKTWADDYLTFVAKQSGTFTFTPQNNNVISYSTNNGETWTEGNSISVNNGDKVLWKGTMTSQEYYGIGEFGSTGNFDVQGNVMSLLYGDNFKGQTNLTGKDYAFYNLFKGNTKVVNAENLSLPATTLANNCYNSMFSGCTSLTTAPELPATTLANWCYGYMFANCTSLTTAPALPATTLAYLCYIQMFYNCTSLTTAPELPATTLGQSCYERMFKGCTSLTTAPELPATTLTAGCYNFMFSNTNIIPDCSNIDFTSETIVSSGGLRGLFAETKITDADLENILPKNTNGKYCLPVTTLAENCYYNMFNGCTSLTTAPELPATTLANGCYGYMFQGCTNLTKAPELPATTLANDCYERMFSGCTSLTIAPELPATTLVQSCYGRMFNGCTSLTTAPELPATTLANWCYNGMFNGCTSLNYIKAMFTTTPGTNYTPNWVSGVSATGTFVRNSAATWNVSGANGIPTGWTVQRASA